VESIGEEYAGGSEIAMGDLMRMQEAKPFEDLEEDEFTLEGRLACWEGALSDVRQILMEISGVEVDGLHEESAFPLGLTAHGIHPQYIAMGVSPH
jgi:hypothetical protein